MATVSHFGASALAGVVAVAAAGAGADAGAGPGLGLGQGWGWGWASAGGCAGAVAEAGLGLRLGWAGLVRPGQAWPSQTKPSCRGPAGQTGLEPDHMPSQAKPRIWTIVF